MAKVLIADDSDMMRRIAKMSLEKGGHTVIEASNGAEAVEFAKRDMPDIILLDVEMPEMDGSEASRAIKGDPQTAKIPVLMCSGHDMAEEPEALAEAKADGYITKPYNPVIMNDKIKQTLGG
jgi:CheY-like chemotaxis protein